MRDKQDSRSAEDEVMGLLAQARAGAAPGELDFGALDEASLQRLDAHLAAAEAGRWTDFYADRARPCPFFVDKPDENLVRWLDAGALPVRGRALDVGCGHGRNALYLARCGWAVQALDASPTALAWARERVAASGLPVQLIQGQAQAFRSDDQGPGLDLVYDAGCFHHIAPHRRPGYLAHLAAQLRPGGWLGLVSFRPEGGSGWSDAEVYHRASLGGGLGYEAETLQRWLAAAGLEVLELAPMREQAAEAPHFGRGFLWTLLARRAC
jgi:SAM-dependent methyltransferase